MKYTSGEYRDTELDILFSCWGYKENWIKEAEFFGDMVKWWNFDEAPISSDKFLIVKGWREKLKIDLHEATYDRWVNSSEKVLKIVNSMAPYRDWNANEKSRAFWDIVYKWDGTKKKDKDKSGVGVTATESNYEETSWSFIRRAYIYFERWEYRWYIDVDSKYEFVYSLNVRDKNGDPVFHAGDQNENFFIEDLEIAFSKNTMGEFAEYVKSTNRIKIIRDFNLNVNSGTTFEFLLNAYAGMLKYGSPENYLKQVIASRKEVSSTLKNEEAWWLSPKGVLYPVMTGHAMEVKENPRFFGFSENYMGKIIEKALRDGDNADDRILGAAVKKGWVRIRINAGKSYIYVWDLNEKTKAIIGAWAVAYSNVEGVNENMPVNIRERKNGKSEDYALKDLNAF